MKRPADKIANEVWGDFHVPHWNSQDNTWFRAWLQGAALNLLLTEQHTIDRVTKEVRELISLAKAGSIEPKVAIEKVMFDNVFSEEERENIMKTAKKHGTEIMKFHSSDKTIN